MENPRILMEAIPFDGAGTSSEGRNTHTTSISFSQRLLELDANMIDKMKGSMIQIGSSFADIVVADEVEMEFSFGITGNGSVCILSGSSSLGIKVVFKWNKCGNIKD